jgi:hypothetical protein
MRETSRSTALTILVLSLAGATPATAQWFQGAAYVAAGVARTATGSLDDHLAAQQYPRFGPGAATVSIGAYATVASRLMLGAEWNGVIKGNQEYQGRTIWLGGGYGTLGAGYAIRTSPRTRVFPRIGVGVGGLGLTFDSTEDSVSFDDVLTTPDAQADQTRPYQPTLTRDHSVVDLGLGAEWLPARSGRGTFVGMRLGYVLAPSTNDWRFNHRPVRGGPDATIAGPYFRVMLGAAAWR